ncbi:RNA-dependent DNA polymerase [Pseudoscourfieldia marina]
MVALDLTDGYFHLDMAEESRTYMAFRIGKRLFRMAAVPFGWNHAPSAFTKLLEPVVAHLRQPQRAEQREVSRTQKHIPLRQRAGHRHARLLWYMDDFLLAGRTAKETAALRDGAAGLFAKLGLTLQQEKCVWEPTQRLKHLGLIVDTKLGIFQVDEGKADKLRRLARDLLCEAQRSQRKVRKRELAAFAGLGQFVHLALRPARFHLREIYDVIGTLQGWNGRVALTKQALRDLRWWARLRAEDTGCPIWRPIETATLHTDSSGFAWGAVLDGKLEARGYWTSEEAEDHITLNELRAVTRAVTTFRSQLEGKTVQHFEDNMGVVYIINGLTTRSPAIMAELRLLWRVLDLNGINLLTEYINTKANVHADALSRLDDEEDWQLNPKVFRMIDAVEQHSVDRFATALNTLLPRFNSRWEQPGAEAVNSLALSDEHWRSEKNWCNPPWSLLPTLADKLEQSGAAATVVTPDWPRENWAAKLDALAIEVTRIPAHTGLFIPGRRRTAHGAGAPRWDVVRQYKVQQGAIAPWAGAIRKRMERIAPGDPDGLTDWIAQSLSAGSYRTYGGTWRMFQKYCDEAGVCSLPATSYTVACYLKWLGERGTVQKKSLKPYLSVINTVHKDLGYRQRPAIGALVKSMKQAYGRKVIRIRPAPRILVMPARIILDMWRRVEELTALPDLEYITKLPEIRALLACIVCYITGSRPSSIALLPLTGVAFALGSELGIQRSYVKTAPDACDFDVPGRRTVSWPVTATWQTLGRMLMRYDRMRRRVCSRATYFFNLGEKARGDAFARWLPVALRAVGAAAPPNGHYAPKSFRSGFASAVTAMNVSPDRRNYIAGWAANSHAVGTHYVDNSVVVDDAARFLFGHLIGLPPPPVEVPVAPVAPWSSPLANLASRLVTLVSPLRGDT